MIKRFFTEVSSQSFLLSLALLLTLSSCTDSTESIESAVAKVSNPKTTRNSWIEDSSGIINNSQAIDALISENESKTGVEIAVVILPTIDSYVPKDFAVALFNHWGIGKKGKDNGILILHVLDQRRIEIETGYGMEGDLPDVVVKRIIDTYSIPAFKADDFSKGHLETVTALINKLNHPELEIEQLVSSEPETQSETSVEEVQSEAIERTDIYDYQGKSYLQLTDEEKKILDACLETYNTTSNYFLTDEESRLLDERATELARVEKEKIVNLKIKVFLGYLTLIAGLFLLSRLLYFIIPSPDFKYVIIKHTDFPIFYGVVIIPVLSLIFIVSHFWEEEIIFFSLFISIATFVIFNIIWGDLRLNLLSKRLLKIRSIPRKCPNCKQTMIKLSEKEDNAHLSRGQIAEEIVKSIDYDVWVCSACEANEILPFPTIDPEFIFDGTSFRKIKKCPECDFETFVCKESHILSAATYSSSGRVEVIRKCRHCKHEQTEYETIPKKQKSSSSGGSSGGGGGGSFGGGSSGGGGSGGSY